MRCSISLLFALWALPVWAMDSATVTGTQVVNGHAVLHLDDGSEVALADIIIPAAAPDLAGFKGNEVTLQGFDEDRYGRSTAIAKPRGRGQQTLQETLLADGEALTYSMTALKDWPRWHAAEHEAEANHRGIWAKPLVITPEQAQHRLQQFVIVEGRVAHIHQARDAYYINFGENWKTDFSIKIPRTNWRSFADALPVAEGSTIRARGTLISENGPMLVLTRPEQMEKKNADTQ